MKVILVEDVRNLGKRNDVKTVSDGYAAHFLFPKKLAISATADNIVKQQALIAREETALAALREDAARMEKETLSFALKTGSHGEIFNSITKDDIMKCLAEKGYKGVKTVDLHTAIKKIGVYSVVIHLERGIAATVRVTTQ